MLLNAIDWCIVAAYAIFSLAVGLIFTRRASQGLRQYFAAGSAMPWYLLGTSMVATTFSTDTPNLVTNIVRTKGVAGNWIWWAYLLTGMTTVFLYARLWRRSNAITDLEFYELRYSGWPAAAVRGFRAIYLGVFFNVLVMASVTLAASKIANVLFGWNRVPVVLAAGGIALALSIFSGIWGVVVTDFVQFAMAMVGSVGAAYFAVTHERVGGLGALLSRIPEGTLALIPEPRSTLFLTAIAIPFLVQWWSTWYPGAEPGGGSYVAQRMLAAKDERHALLATLWFNVAHYAIRPWPWILVALCSIVVFPDIEVAAQEMGIDEGLVEEDIAYPMMLRMAIPHVFLGILVASLLAAYISTIDTHLNWGASYIVSDFYRRFICPDASDRHYILASRLATAGLMVLACGLSLWLESALQSFKIMLQVGAGTGLVFLLRWYWHRINAWSEISAMVASGVLVLAVIGVKPCLKGSAWGEDEVLIAISALVNTVVWLAITFATPRVDSGTLRRFWAKVRPSGPGWKPVRDGLPPDLKPSDDIRSAIFGTALGIAFVYAGLFGTGFAIYGRYEAAAACGAIFAATGLLLGRHLRRSIA